MVDESKQRKEEKEAAAGAVDPKKAGKPGAKDAKKEDPKAAAGKAVKKTPQ